MSDDITMGELARRIDAVLSELRRIEDRYVSREAHEALKARVEELEDRYVSREAHGALKARVEELEERAKFVSRIAWSGLIVPFLLAVFLVITIKGSP